MKYANGMIHLDGQQVNAFVCAKTYKRMLELLPHIGYSHFNNYWNKHGNDRMKATAQDQEGVWIENADRTYIPYNKAQTHCLRCGDQITTGCAEENDGYCKKCNKEEEQR